MNNKVKSDPVGLVPARFMILQDANDPRSFVAVGGPLGRVTLWLRGPWSEVGTCLALLRKPGTEVVRMADYPETSALHPVPWNSHHPLSFLPLRQKAPAPKGKTKARARPAAAAPESTIVIAGGQVDTGPIAIPNGGHVITEPPIEVAVRALEAPEPVETAAA